jgi:GAF domain-containing protein
MSSRPFGRPSRNVDDRENLPGAGCRDGPQDMTEEPADFRASIAELQAVLLGTASIDGFLQELASLAARELGEGLSCGITLQPNGKPLTVASSDASASQVDELQYGLDYGPCLTSLRQGELIRVEDLASDHRWADYAVRALAHGVRSSLSMPLAAQERTVGALNLYSDRPHFFGEAQTRLAERFAQDATIAVASLASRAVIDQAIGVIMAEQRCDAASAFAILRAASQNRNIKLRQIAEQIITGITGRPPQPPPFSP